jgi:hypothetical protein
MQKSPRNIYDRYCKRFQTEVDEDDEDDEDYDEMDAADRFYGEAEIDSRLNDPIDGIRYIAECASRNLEHLEWLYGELGKNKKYGLIVWDVVCRDLYGRDNWGVLPLAIKHARAIGLSDEQLLKPAMHCWETFNYLVNDFGLKMSDKIAIEFLEGHLEPSDLDFPF